MARGILRLDRRADALPLPAPGRRLAAAAPRATFPPQGRPPATFLAPSRPLPCESCSSGSESASSPTDSPTRRFLPEQQQRLHPHQDYFPYAPAEHAFAYPTPLPQSTLQFYYARSRPPLASVAVAQRAPVSSRSGRRCLRERATACSTRRVLAATRSRSTTPTEATRPRRRSSSRGHLWLHLRPPRESSWDFLNVFDNYDDSFCSQVLMPICFFPPNSYPYSKASSHCSLVAMEFPVLIYSIRAHKFFGEN